MKINHTNKTIELTKTENSAASRFGSEMYNKLREVRQDNPSYTIHVNKKTVHKSAYLKHNEAQFTVEVDVEVSVTFYSWLCQFGTRAKILYPKDVADKYKAFLKEIIKQY